MCKLKWKLAAALTLAVMSVQASASSLVIRRAVYEAIDGAGSGDVTDTVKAMVKDGRLCLQATNQVLGGDPIPMHRKQLRVEYVVDGKAKVAVVGEGGALEIPPIPPWQRAERLIPVLKSDASLHEKCDACRQLAIAGGAKAVPVLASLLVDEKLSHAARCALEPISGPEVDDAFRQALGQVKGPLLVGVINSIGVRHDAGAVDELAKVLGDADPAVASAAAGALGRIGTSAAAKAFEQAVSGAPPDTQIAIYDGLLRCADALRSQGQRKEARAIYDRVRGSQAPKPIRAAALRGAILVGGSEGKALLLEQLHSADQGCFAVALRGALELPGTEVTQALASELSKLPAARQVLLIQALSKRYDRAALPGLLASAKSGEASVRLVAVRVLPEMGDPSAARLLIGLATDADVDIARAARESLACLPGKEVDAAVMGMLDGKDAALRTIAIELIARRRMTTAIPSLLKLADDSDQETRLAALKTLAELAGSTDVPALLDRLMEAKGRKDRDGTERALSAVAARHEAPTQCAQQVIGRLAQATPEQKISMLHVLTTCGGPNAMRAVRAAVDDPNGAVHAAAIRDLGRWKTAEAAPGLLELAKTCSDAKDKLLCLRSYIGLARNSRLPVVQRLAICGKAQALVLRDEEKKLLLGTLGGIASPEALAIATPYLSREATREEASAAVVSVAEQLMRQRRTAKTNAPRVIAPLQEAAKATANAGLAKRASAVLKTAQSMIPRS